MDALVGQRTEAGIARLGSALVFPGDRRAQQRHWGRWQGSDQQLGRSKCFLWRRSEEKWSLNSHVSAPALPCVRVGHKKSCFRPSVKVERPRRL